MNRLITIKQVDFEHKYYVYYTLLHKLFKNIDFFAVKSVYINRGEKSNLVPQSFQKFKY